MWDSDSSRPVHGLTSPAHFVVCHPIPANIISVLGTRLVIHIGLSTLITTTD
jgi:hypothetical protein